MIFFLQCFSGKWLQQRKVIMTKCSKKKQIDGKEGERGGNVGTHRRCKAEGRREGHASSSFSETHLIAGDACVSHACCNIYMRHTYTYIQGLESTQD